MDRDGFGMTTFLYIAGALLGWTAVVIVLLSLFKINAPEGDE